MLDANLKAQLTGYLARLSDPVELVASLDDRPESKQMRTLLEDLASLNPKVSARFDGTDARRPAFQIRRVGSDMGVRFAAVPMGHEFTSLVLALLQAGGVAPKVEPALIERIRSLDPGRDLVFETWMSLTCHNCPDVVQALNLMAVLNPRIRHVAIDGGLFEDEAAQRGILAVPTVMLGGEPLASGRMSIAEILAKIDTGAAQRTAQDLARKPPFDVLIVGAGPAGAAAAVYAARKGIRTGIVADRFGGQTLDTMGIENYVSVPYTEGPKFASALQQHALQYEVDVMEGQRAAALRPAPTDTAAGPPLLDVELESGATLRARAIVLAPGARWRTIGVPGEAEYRNKGVTFCPHCDGPLFKGKPVAVIGGGNSGVEAAIDLAGIVERVTLIEWAPTLKADAVLVRKLESLANVTIVANAQTLRIAGDGRQVTGLVYQPRAGGEPVTVPVAGVFVQIGLVPNTEWLQDALALSRHGEIEVDGRGATSVPGVFAAGDATTTPYKQIVIAAGEGARAALSAFDHLIRSA